MDGRLGIDELAEAAGLTRRAVRFYVQQKLLPAPLGVGRGKHYDRSHLDRLKRLQELQSAGYSLDMIRQILDGREPTPLPNIRPPASSARRRRAAEGIELWTRLNIADGVELHVDTGRFDPGAERLVAACKLLRDTLGITESSECGRERETPASGEGRNIGEE